MSRPLVVSAAPVGADKEVDAAFRRFITAFNNLDWEAFRNALHLTGN